MKRTTYGMVLLILTCGSANAISFTPLGDLAGGRFQSAAFGTSADGSVVVGVGTSSGGAQAFRWTGGVMTGLGDLAGGDFNSRARAVSADGSVVVGWGASAPGIEALRWTGGVMTSLGDLAGGFFISVANDTSADGSVVVGHGNSASGTEAFRWTGGVMTGLGDLAGGGFNSVAYGVSADGSVVVGYGDSASGIEAFRWTGGVMTGLGDLAGGSFNSIARGTSADGSVVVGSGDSASGTEAFRWTGGVMTGLGDLAGGGFNSIAYGVSADGSVVVGYGESASGIEAIIWTAGGGMERLFDVLVAGGATGLTGWTLQEATGISDDGQWIAGYGINSLGEPEAFLANISAGPAPPAAVDDGPIAVIEGVAQALPVGVNDTGFTNLVTVAVTTQPTKGTITAISPPGPAAGMTVTYTANVGAVGNDSFVYEMTDSSPAADSATVTLRISQDTDGDGVVNETDNCTLTANADQRDTNGDGYGNICDPDFNNNGIVDSQDGAILKATFGSNAFPDYDLNGNGIVDSNDGARLKAKFGKPPGPSGLRP